MCVSAWLHGLILALAWTSLTKELYFIQLYTPWLPQYLLLLLVASVVSDSVQPHRWQPTRLPHPWDSPGKNTGVGCYLLLQCMKVKSEKWKWSRSVMSNPSRPHGLQPIRLLRPWDSPGKSTGVGCHCLLHNKVYKGLIFSIAVFSPPTLQITGYLFHIPKISSSPEKK